MSEPYVGTLTNVAFKHLVLSWRPDGVVGFFPTQEGQDLTQTWRVEVFEPSRSPNGIVTVTIMNARSMQYLGHDGMNVTSNNNPFIWYIIHDVETRTVRFQVPVGPTLELPLGEPGTKVTLALNGGALTDEQQWTQDYWNW
ncbi:hypothetical protein M405DRAFT_804433 [Rhizopogon salebrosus TDB-379]|nr:hypothetical protein M405DRAFT_804433 [Rhizopogon salebrosus TDB-379]